MPKHAFKFPAEVAEKIRRHVENAVQATDPRRYNQEPHYVASLITRLEGTAYEGPHGSVRFESTAAKASGPNSAEWQYGADFAITAAITNGIATIEKAILVQAKLADVTELTPNDLRELKTQIRKMRELVAAPKVLDVPTSDLFRDPRMISGNKILAGQPFRALRLSDYFVARVTTTLDGATNQATVLLVKDSPLARVNVFAKIRSHGTT